MQFKDRREAGIELAKLLVDYAGKDVIVLALPRGGVVPAVEVAKALEAPMDIVLVRKIGHPANPEYAVGAVVFGEEPVYGDDGLPEQDKSWVSKSLEEQEKTNKDRKELYYGDSIEPLKLDGKIVIIVDDGIATGLTMQAAVSAVNKHNPSELVVAVPVAPADSVTYLQSIADKVVVAIDPNLFLGAVGAHYNEFTQVDDETVKELLEDSRSA